ncbi:MAG TPA: hypothetical protein VKS44_03725 [Candidatus Acidoferrales bacterium]|nr:hypothetical protein [Candidatus Acidoferrales bacterium]
MRRESACLAILAFLARPGPSAARVENWKCESGPANLLAGSQQKHNPRAQAEKVDVHIAGAVSLGKAFEYDIGRGLAFRLVPPANASDAGWIIEIVPKTEPEDGPVEFSAIATPPYHVYNDRIIATLYGRSASEVVQLKDRTFFFVRSVDDEHRAEEVVNAAFYPTDLSDQERVRIAAEQHDVTVSKGELRILKSHTGRSKTLNDLGAINWIRFEVDIEFSPGLTMADIIARVVRPQ